jgi:hypothetical protein
MRNQITIKNLVNCARCGNDHSNLLFRRLKQPCGDLKFWCSCPVNGEPILMAVAESEDKNEQAH